MSSLLAHFNNRVFGISRFLECFIWREFGQDTEPFLCQVLTMGQPPGLRGSVGPRSEAGQQSTHCPPSWCHSGCWATIQILVADRWGSLSPQAPL